MNKKKDTIELEGIILASLGNKSFRVKLNKTNKIAVVTIASKLRRKIVQGDKVLLAISTYDPTKGWIVNRLDD